MFKPFLTLTCTNKKYYSFKNYIHIITHFIKFVFSLTENNRKQKKIL